MNIKKIAVLLIVIGIVVGIRFSGFGDFLSFENFVQKKEVFKQNIDNNYFVAVISFILIYISVVAFSIPGATVMTLAGGFLFGLPFGLIYVNMGATVGAILAFLFARYMLGDSLQDKYGERLAKFNSELETNGKYYMLTLRLIPVFPFFLINLFAGLTNLKLRTFFWTTAVGILPGSLAYTFAGKSLDTIQSPKDIVSKEMIAAFVLLALVTLIPVILKKFKRDKEFN